MLPLHEQLEFEQFDVGIQINVHHGIITDFHLVLNAELPGSRVEHWRIIGSMISYVNANLRIHSLLCPPSVVIEIVVETDARQGHGRVRTKLPYHAVLQIHPRGCDVHSGVRAEHLYVAGMLHGQPAAIEINRVRDILKPHLGFGFHPFIRITYLATYVKPIDFGEIVVLDIMVGAIMLKEEVGRLISNVRARAHAE